MKKSVYANVEKQLKVLEEKLKQKEKEIAKLKSLEDLINNSPAVGIRWEWGKGWPVSYVSDGISQWGYSPEEFYSGKLFFNDIMHPDDVEPIHKDGEEQRKQGKQSWNHDYRIITKNGKIRWINDYTWIEYFESKETIKCFSGVMLDITERKMMEEALKQSEALLKETQRLAKIGSWEGDNDSEYLVWSDETYRILGRDPSLGAPTRKEFWDYIHPEDKPGYRLLIEAAREKGTPFSSDLRIILPDNSIKHVHAKGFGIKNERGIVYKIHGYVQDITEQKKSEEALRKSEEKYRNLFDTMTQGVVYQDSDGKIISANQAAERILGLSVDEMKGRTSVDQRCHSIKEDGSEFPGDMHPSMEALRTGKEIQNVIMGVYNHQNKKYSWIKIDAIPQFRENEKKPYQVYTIFDDITKQKEAEVEKKKLEEQLYQSQKMESIGRLAGGIAHDFNNILVGIMGYAELLKMHFKDTDSKEGEAAEVILKSAVRAAKLTKQLLGFARKGKYNPVSLNINELIQETISVTEKIFGKKIRVNFDFEEDIEAIEGDKNQLDQVLTNIIINARDAMPGGGTLTLKTENVYIDKRHPEYYWKFKPGPYVKITITDTGIGMTEQIKSHIFEPFFSTKGAGKGTGLGLAMVYGIVKNHGGYIEVESQVHKGTSFILYFPASKQEIQEVEEKKKIFRGDATILIVDDEKYVRNLSEEMLNALGYKILTAENGKEAVEIYRDKQDSIDMVLLDMIMPEQGGKETYFELKKIEPGVKVLLSSGFSMNGQAEEILKAGVRGFIQKPYSIIELSEKVHEVLKGNS